MTEATARSVTARASLGTTALLWNEARALLPIWMAGVGAVTIAGLTDGPGVRALRRLIFVDIHAVSLVVCLASMIGLGAQIIGHEYSNRTLGVTLMLPLGRRRLFWLKQATLATLLLPLVVCVWWLDVFDKFPALPWLAAGTALTFAPVWTILCQSALAGAVFSAAVPGTVLTIISIVVRTFFGLVDDERVALEAWTWLMAALLPIGGVLAWHLFLRLEAIEGRATDISLRWLTGKPRAAVPGHPLWVLLKKELRLQQMAFALTALFVTGATAIALWDTWMYGDRLLTAPLRAASAVYWSGLPVLIGALATAEERQLGTIAWQLQLPTPSRLQWAVKIGTVFSLAILLAVIAPALLTEVLWPVERRNLPIAFILAIVTTAASVYISSLCTTGVRAAVTSLAAIPLSLWLVAAFALAIRRPPVSPALWTGREGSWLVVIVLLVLTLISLAFVNHRPDPPPLRRVWQQSLAIAVVLTAGVIGLEIARL